MKKHNFAKMPNEDMRKFMKHYCLDIPEDKRGNLIRAEAIKILTDYQDMLSKEEDRRVKVIFHRTGDSTQGSYVFIGHNGKGIQIPFDTEVVLSESALKVVDDAVITKYEQSRSPSSGQLVYEERHKQIYPYTKIEYMDAEGMMVPDMEDGKEEE